MKYFLSFLFLFALAPWREASGADLVPHLWRKARATKGASVRGLTNPYNIPPNMRWSAVPHTLVLEWTVDPQWPTKAFVVRAQDLLNPKMNWSMSSTNDEPQLYRPSFTNYWHDIAIVLNTNRFEFVPAGAQSFHVSRLCGDGEPSFEDGPIRASIKYK